MLGDCTVHFLQEIVTGVKSFVTHFDVEVTQKIYLGL